MHLRLVDAFDVVLHRVFAGHDVARVVAQFLQGGFAIGQDTLAKFYSLHMLVLPGAIIALIGLHIYLVTRLGVTSPPWSAAAAGRERPEQSGNGRGR
ncbi:MAG: cytochrome b N-terminal domain-containing protein, partial [Fimbriimonadaceae bacterium]